MKNARLLAAVVMSALVVVVSSPAISSENWVVIDGTEGSWCIDVNSITVNKDAGVTFYTETMSATPGISPSVGGPHVPVGYEIYMAVNCTTGEEFTYNKRRETWGPERTKWNAEYHASVRRLVCGKQ